MTKWVGVLGTWGFKPDATGLQWWQHGSTFAESLKVYGLHVARPGHEFVWTGDLDGTWWNRGNDWEAGAVNLEQYLGGLRPEDRNVIAHSHGGAVALLAATQIPIRSLVTIGTPARKEVRAAAKEALSKGYLGAWRHVYDSRIDWMGWLGALMDGQFRTARAMQIDGCVDTPLKGIGHSGLLSGTQGPLLDASGILTTLREAR